MKKTVLLCVVILLFAAAALSGCVTREQAQGHGAEETPAPTAEQATPEPTPVPTPTPLPYELAASLDAVDYGVCESDGDVFAAVERLRERHVAGGANRRRVSVAGPSRGVSKKALIRSMVFVCGAL